MTSSHKSDVRPLTIHRLTLSSDHGSIDGRRDCYANSRRHCLILGTLPNAHASCDTPALARASDRQIT